MQQYHFTDLPHTAFYTTVYYRVKKQGLLSTQYSEVIKIDLAKPSYFSVYQNNSNLVLKFKNTIREKMNIQIISTAGRIMHQQQTIPNETMLNMSLLNLSKGIYIISVTSSNQILNQKLLIN